MLPSSHTTSGRTDLAAVARGAGVERAVGADSTLAFGEAFDEALETDDLSVIVAKVEATGPDRYGMDFALPENAFRFRRSVQERRAAATGWTPPPLPTTSGAA